MKPSIDNGMTDQKALEIAKTTIEQHWAKLTDIERGENLELMEAVSRINVIIEFGLEK